MGRVGEERGIRMPEGWGGILPSRYFWMRRILGRERVV